MSKLKNPTCYRHTATRVRSKMVNALLMYQGNGTAIWMMYCYVIDNCFYHSAFSRLEEVESDGVRATEKKQPELESPGTGGDETFGAALLLSSPHYSKLDNDISLELSMQ